jgi:HPt (histidine-containing phosphotransfer) domain-containing protein
MIKEETETEAEKICNLTYLSEMMGHKKHLITGIMDTFLHQIPMELNSIKKGIEEINYATIKNFAHTMKSSVSIMGISVVTPVLQEMEDLGKKAANMERIKELNQKLNLLCSRAISEIEKEKHKYI